jgi:hypothetical protein
MNVAFSSLGRRTSTVQICLYKKIMQSLNRINHDNENVRKIGQGEAPTYEV